VILRGKKIGYAAIRGKELDLRPRIAGYCRVLPRSGTEGNSERGNRSAERRVGARGLQLQRGRTASVRISPPGTAWDRINFFLRPKMGREIGLADCGQGLQTTTGWGGPLKAASEKRGSLRRVRARGLQHGAGLSGSLGGIRRVEIQRRLG
jgi:hypothetical protein